MRWAPKESIPGRIGAIVAHLRDASLRSGLDSASDDDGAGTAGAARAIRDFKGRRRAVLGRSSTALSPSPIVLRLRNLLAVLAGRCWLLLPCLCIGPHLDVSDDAFVFRRRRNCRDDARTPQRAAPGLLDVSIERLELGRAEGSLCI